MGCKLRERSGDRNSAPARESRYWASARVQREMSWRIAPLPEMDGLLIKSLQRARLHQALLEFGLARPAPGPAGAEAPGHAESVEEPADLVTLRAKFEGDTAFVQRLCQTFPTSVSPLLSELGRAAEAGERTLVRTLAHRIKGAGANIQAHRVAMLAARLESESARMALPGRYLYLAATR